MKIYNLSFFLLIPIISGLLFQLVSCNQGSELPKASLLPDSVQDLYGDTAGAAHIVFRSADSGQTWQNISKGLPENLQQDSIRENSFYANDKGLFLKVGKERYHSTANATAPFWIKEHLPDENSSIAPGKYGISAYKYWGVQLKNKNGSDVWSPVFENIEEPRIRCVFETAGGAIFIGTNRGLYKTADSGKTWKQVYNGGLAGNLAAWNGVLLATSMKRIIRSDDNGENWTVVTSGDDVVWDVKQINGGFAAITAGSASETRRLRTSYDGGKSWQPIGAGLRDKVTNDSIWSTWNDRPRPQAVMTSIVPFGENFFCAHPDGIFKSTDKGITWKLLLPSIKGMVFNVYVSGNVIYAILSRDGC